MSDAAAWLKPSFVKTMRQLSEVDEALLQHEAEQLLAAWNAPERTFHNQRYLRQTLSCLDDLSTLIHEPAILSLAAWYHGIVTRDALSQVCPSGGVLNIPASADYAHQHLLELGVASQAATRVGELILMLSDYNPPAEDMDARVFLDAATSFLGVPPQEYREMCQAWRQEFSQLDEGQYLRMRRGYVKKLLSRDQIFFSPAGQDLEEVAGQNLAGEFARLNAALPDKSSSQSDPAARTERDARRGTHETGETVVIKAKITRPVPRKSILPPEREIKEVKTRVPVAELLKAQQQLQENQALAELHDQHNGQSTMESVADILSTMSRLKPIKNEQTLETIEQVLPDLEPEEELDSVVVQEDTDSVLPVDVDAEDQELEQTR